MDKVCKTCYYCKGSWCNRLVIPGGMGMRDIVASYYLKNNECKYYVKGEPETGKKPNFENS